MRDTTDIIELALSVSRAALARYAALWTDEDREDAHQVAAEHIWCAIQRMPDANSGYYARAGYTGVQEWCVARFQQCDADRVFAGYAAAGLDAARRGWHDGKPWEEALTDEQQRLIALVLAKMGKRTSERDAVILERLSRGYTQKEIGDEFGMSRWQIGVYRQRTRKALERYIEEREHRYV